MPVLVPEADVPGFVNPLTNRRVRKKPPVLEPQVVNRVIESPSIPGTSPLDIPVKSENKETQSQTPSNSKEYLPVERKDKLSEKLFQMANEGQTQKEAISKAKSLKLEHEYVDRLYLIVSDSSSVSALISVDEDPDENLQSDVEFWKQEAKTAAQRWQNALLEELSNGPDYLMPYYHNREITLAEISRRWMKLVSDEMRRVLDARTPIIRPPVKRSASPSPAHSLPPDTPRLSRAQSATTSSG